MKCFYLLFLIVIKSEDKCKDGKCKDELETPNKKMTVQNKMNKAKENVIVPNEVFIIIKFRTALTKIQIIMINLTFIYPMFLKKKMILLRKEIIKKAIPKMRVLRMK